MTHLIITNDPVATENEVLKHAKTYNPSDVFWVKHAPDKKEITVDVITNMINQANLAAVSGKKLFIVFDADLMNTAAQNKLLKTIENTDDNTTFIFICRTLNTILSTIRSRSILHYQNNPADKNQTLQQLKHDNPNSEQLYQAAQALIAIKSIDTALPYMPLITANANSPLVWDALTQAIKNSKRTAAVKLKLYDTIAIIKRNIEANCNPTNAFDFLLMTLMSYQ